MPGNISQFQVVIAGQLITANLWNGMETNIIDNGLTPSGIDDHSVNDAQMQVQTDPFPSGATSRPSSMAGEQERVRYQLSAIIGRTYWYQDPEISLSAALSRIEDLEDEFDVFQQFVPVGTKMVFYQASVPSGWTAVAVNDKFLRVVTNGGSGGSTGGSVAASTSLAHTHSMPHTHTIAHKHYGPVAMNGAARYIPNQESDWDQGSTSVNRTVIGITSSGATTITVPHLNTSDSLTANSGAASSSTTDSALGAFAYADVVIGTKD